MKSPLIVIACLLMVASLAWAQTPPPAETTFSNVSGNLWGTAGNWDNGVPTTTAGDPLLDDAWVAADQTVVYDQAIEGNAAFGTLTLASGATLQGKILSGSTNANAFLNGKVIYFNNNSTFQITGGSYNSAANLQILSGATGTLSGSITMVNGVIGGAGNLNVVHSGNTEWRATATSLSGNLNFSSSNTGSRRVGLSRFSGTNVFGTGTTTFSDNVYFASSVNGTTTNKLSSSSTLKMVGDSGTTAAKMTMGTNNQTVANLIVDSPGKALTGTQAFLTNGNATTAGGTLTVSNTVTFQGAANTIEIDNLMTTPTGNSLVVGNMTFQGTGDWSLIGDGAISLNSGATITTTGVNASIANPLAGSNGFTKAGSGTLSLTGDLSGFSGSINVTGGELALAGANFDGMTLAASTALTIGSSATAGDVINLGAGDLVLGEDSTINWQFNGASGGSYDSIVTTGSLDLTSISNLIINGESLGYEAQAGDTFTLFSGTVTGFDPGKFTLNMPTLSGGATWAIQEGSLVLVVVPEASSLLLGGLGTLLLLRRRRR